MLYLYQNKLAKACMYWVFISFGIDESLHLFISPFSAPACSIYRASTCTQFVFFFFALKYRRFYWIFSFFLFLIKQYFLRVPLIKHFINFITKVFSLTYLRDGKIRCDVLNIAYWKERKHSKNKIINKRNKENTRKKYIYKLAWHACMIQWCSYK